MTQTLRPHRDPYAAQYNPNAQYNAQPNYVNRGGPAPIPAGSPWAGQRPQGPGPFALQAQPQQPYSPFGPEQPVAHGFDIRPRLSNRRGLWIGLGVGAVLVAVIVALVVALVSGGGDSSTGSSKETGLVPAGDLTPEPTSKPSEPQGGSEKPSTDADEEEIVQLVEDFGVAAKSRIQVLTLTYYCEADRQVVLNSGSPNVIVPTKNYDPTAIPTDIVVKGKRARADLNGDTIKFLKESGAWTICMTG